MKEQRELRSIQAPVQEKMELPDLSILQQVDYLFDNPSNPIIVLHLKANLKAEQWIKLSQYIDTKTAAWKATKAEDEPELRWTLRLGNMQESLELIDFIIHQLQNRRLGVLSLQLNLSNEAIDRILKACLHSPLLILAFANGQKFLEYQAKALLKCLLQETLTIVDNIDGMDITDETAEQLAALNSVLGISNCLHYTIRSRIERSIEHNKLYSFYADSYYEGFPIKSLFEYFQAKDIKKLTEQLSNLLDNPICLGFASTLDEREWANFFKAVLSSKAPVEKLIVSSAAFFSDEIMNALIFGIGQNKTLKEIEFHTTNPLMATALLQALASHPSLRKLTLSGDWDHQAEGFEKLLMQTQNLRSLDLSHTSLDNCMQGIAAGLKKNETLEQLYLNKTLIRAFDMPCLAYSLTMNHHLERLTFHPFTTLAADFFKTLYQYNFTLLTINTPNLPSEARNLKELLFNRNLEICKAKYQAERNDFVNAVTLLLQAARQGHSRWGLSFVCDKVFDFLSPSNKVAFPAQTKRCSDLIRLNLSNRVWNPVLEEKMSWGTSKCTIFQKWSQEKSEESKIEPRP